MPFVGTDPGRPPASPRPGQASPSRLTGALGAIKPHAQPLPPNPYDTSSDPTLQRILANDVQRREDATSEALRIRQQLAIGYGDPELARSLGLDDATIAAAGQNPFSTLAEEKKAEHDQPLTLDENLNKQNLFYSGHGNEDRGNLAMALLKNRATASGDVQGKLGDVTSGLAKTLTGITTDDTTAYTDAATRRTTQLGDTPVPPPSPFTVPTDSRAVAGGVAGAVAAALGKPKRPGSASKPVPRHSAGV